MKFFKQTTSKLFLVLLALFAFSMPIHVAANDGLIAPKWCTELAPGGALQGWVASQGVTTGDDAEGAYMDDPFGNSQEQTFESIIQESDFRTILRYNNEADEGTRFTLENQPIELQSILPDDVAGLDFTKMQTVKDNSPSPNIGGGAMIAEGDYSTIRVARSADRIEFSGGTYYIGKLDTGGGNLTMVFNEGDYYFDEFTIPNNSRLHTVGTVRFHIGNKFSQPSGGNKARLNTEFEGGGFPSPESFQIYLYHDGARREDTKFILNNNWEFRGLIFSEFEKTQVELQGDSLTIGGIVIAGALSLGKGAQVVITELDLGTVPGSGGTTDCLDHIRFEYDPQTLSCLAAPISIIPCATEDCDRRYTLPFDLRLTSINGPSPANSLWQDPFSGRSNIGIKRIELDTTALLANVPGGTVTVEGEYIDEDTGVWTPIESVDINRKRCNGSIDASCNLSFSETGLIFSGSNTDPLVQVSPKPAGAVFESYLWALQTEINEGETAATCAPLFIDEPQQTVNFKLQCTDPGSCSGIPYEIESANNGLITVGHDGYSAGTITFNNQGFAPINNRFADVGRIRLDAFMQLEDLENPISEPDDQVAIKTDVLGSGSTLFYPAGIAITLEEAVNAPEPFKAAGENFNLNIISLAMPLPADLSGTMLITPNFGNESSISWTGSTLALGPVTVGVELLEPSEGVLGDFDGELLTTNNGVINYTNVYYHEAGIINAIPQLSNHTYMGHNIGEENYTRFPIQLGTFYPDSLSIVNGSFANGKECGVFTYMDHDALNFSFELEALAMLRDDEDEPLRTENYTAGFPDLATIGLVSAETPSNGSVPENLIERFEIWEVDLDHEDGGTWVVIDALRNDWLNGVLAFTLPEDEYLRFARQLDQQPDGPFRDVRMGLYVESATYGEDIDASGASFDVEVDSDTVSAARIGSADDTQDILYGRLALENIFGPEDEDLPVIMRAEYFNGSRFVLNTLDSCTQFDYNNLSLIPDATLPAKGGDADGELIEGWLPHNQMRWLALEEPGSVEFEYDAPDWLMYIWDEGATELTNPRALGEFGRYRSYDRVLFRSQQ